MFLNYSAGGAELARVQALILRQVYDRLKPELGFAARALHMDVQTRFFAGEKVKPEAAVAKDGRTHPTQLRDARECHAMRKTGDSGEVL